MTGNKGFTLVEILVVLAIFGTAIVVASDLFVRISNTGRRVEALNRLQDDARFVVETIADETRFGRVDYDAYGGPVPIGGSALHLRDASGGAVSFALLNGGLTIFKNGKDAPLTLPGTQVDAAQFWIASRTDRVTFSLSFHGTGESAGTRFVVQTTVSSRVYAK